MPQFENIEQYESTNPKSGKKKIVPIAPHSTQAVDYRPVKRAGGPPRERKSSPPYQKVDVEPVSIRQMEKEFKQAARLDAKRQGRSGLTGLFKAIAGFFKSLFGKDKKKKLRRTRPSGDQRPRGRGNRTQGTRKPRREGESGQEQGKPSGNRPRRHDRSRKPRPDNRGRSQEGQGQSRGENRGENRSRNPDSDPSPKAEDAKSGSRSRGQRRNRRPRNRSQGGSQGNPPQDRGNSEPKN